MPLFIPATAVFILLVTPASAQETITQAELLRRVTDLDRLTAPPAGEQTGMFSSYDRRSTIDAQGNYVAWDANYDRGQFVREEEGGWFVMAEMEGPGAITRIWSANPHGRIRLILDGQTVIQADFADLFNRKLPPFDEPLCYVTPGGGHNCYFPIGYSRNCKLLVAGSTSYYQVNYVSFPRGTPVETFNLELDEQARDALDEVGTVLRHGLSDRQLFRDLPTYPVSSFAELQPGESLDIETLAGGGVIRALHVGLTDRRLPPEPYALHRCILRVYYDHDDQPAVEVPLIDFFGSGFGVQYFRSLPIGTDKRTSLPGRTPKDDFASGAETGPPLPGEAVNENRFMYCYFPMPFKSVARVEIENLSGQKIGLMLWAEVDRSTPPTNSLRFNARFRKEDPCQVLDYPILETTGQGRIVGSTLNVDCPRRAWWGEGDDKVWIDGEPFPSYFGTGSEDYLGDAWGLHAHANALQGATRAAPYGKNSAYRWHLSDCIDFHQSVRFTLENWQHAGARDTYYGTVVYWYGEPAAAHFFQPLTLADLTPPGLRIPDAVEIEEHIVGDDWGNLMKQKYAGGVELSGELAANITGGEPVQVNIPAERARVARLKLRTHPRRAFETIEVTDANGRSVGTAAYNRAANGLYTVGVVRLRPGDNLFTVRCHPKAILDCWILEDIPTRARGPEGEDLKPMPAAGVTVDVEYGTLDWSGGAQRIVDFADVDRTVTFALPTQEHAAAYSVQLLITRGPDGGRFQTMIDDRPVGKSFGTFRATREIHRIILGPVQFAAGEHTIAFRATQANPSATGLRLGLDAVELLKVYSPYAYECETLAIVGSQDTNHAYQGIRGAGAGQHVWCRPTAAEAWIEFEIRVEQAGRYRLAVVYTTSSDYGIVQTYVNGEKAGQPVDTFGQLAPGPIRPLGVYRLPAGPLRVRAKVIGKNHRSPGYYFGVDCIIVEPIAP